MKNLVFTLICLFSAVLTFAQGELIKVKSNHDVTTSLNLLTAVLADKGMNVFSVINHTDGAANVGLELRPTVLVIFGNPRVGTQLMLCDQSIAIELPLKILIWQDEEGETWVGYRDPPGYAEYYNMGGCTEVLARVRKALQMFSQSAAG
jgi:uncharacterized protein (DUF302 family)